MKIKKLLPLTTLLATTSVVVPLATSCAAPTKAIASWSYSQGIYNFTTEIAPKVQEEGGLGNYAATEMYFTYANTHKKILAEDIIWKISNWGEPIVIPIDITTDITLTFGLVPLSASVLVTDAKYDEDNARGLASFQVSYSGYVIATLEYYGETYPLGNMYASGELKFTDIVLFANYNSEQSTLINCWNITNTYYEYPTPQILSTTQVSLELSIPTQASTFWFTFKGSEQITEDSLGFALIEAMTPEYSNYLSANAPKLPPQ